MKGTLKAFLETAQEQLTGKRRPRIWTAYTRSGKVVVIDGYRVIKVMDASKQKGGYAQ